jgi:hypothetical protein
VPTPASTLIKGVIVFVAVKSKKANHPSPCLKDSGERAAQAPAFDLLATRRRSMLIAFTDSICRWLSWWKKPAVNGLPDGLDAFSAMPEVRLNEERVENDRQSRRLWPMKRPQLG